MEYYKLLFFCRDKIRITNIEPLIKIHLCKKRLPYMLLVMFYNLPILVFCKAAKTNKIR